MAGRNDPLQRARTVSPVLGLACLVLAAALPIAVLVAVAGDPRMTAALPRRLAATGLVMLPVLCLSAGLLGVRATFAEFAAGRFFSPGAVRGLRSLARGGAAAALLGLVAGPLAMLVLSANRLELTFSSAQAIQLLLCGLVWTVSSAMERALALADENAALSEENLRLQEENAGFV